MAETVAFFGTLAHSVSLAEPFRVLQDYLIAVQGRKIVILEGAEDEEAARGILRHNGLQADNLQVLEEDEFLMPGLVDTHIHASQLVNIGIGYHLTLLDWLNNITFQKESQFSDIEYARVAYEKAVRRTLKNGTTTASYFATIHVEASLILAEIMEKYGQRGFVGKVCMDKSHPDYYGETTVESITNTRRFIETIRERYADDGLIEACITPRFAVSCSDSLMSQLGILAREYDTPIQTHMSENFREIEDVLSSHPGVEEYVDVYEKAGLLTDRTILAHCVHSGEKELTTIKKYDCGIAHCSNSNTTIRSGAMDARKVLKHGVKLGLGTDVSGGYNPSILDSIRKSTEVSKLISLIKGDYCNRPNEKEIPVDYRVAFFLATLGGAEVMGLQDRIGNLEKGKEFDALRVKVGVEDGPIDSFGSRDSDSLIQAFLYCGDDRNITEIYVAGRRIQF
ncbi:guanine deaminase-like [Watersipora subatra]|uniref:guanine deaminase-like n=1 Tax=Watersipora subatra TaxID=2589382 RepID=UPI00355BBA5E